jgi:hypothetical protein
MRRNRGGSLQLVLMAWAFQPGASLVQTARRVNSKLTGVLRLEHALERWQTEHVQARRRGPILISFRVGLNMARFHGLKHLSIRDDDVLADGRAAIPSRQGAA